jgi:hypothetical protein
MGTVRDRPLARPLCLPHVFHDPDFFLFIRVQSQLGRFHRTSVPCRMGIEAARPERTRRLAVRKVLARDRLQPGLVVLLDPTLNRGLRREGDTGRNKVGLHPTYGTASNDRLVQALIVPPCSNTLGVEDKRP